ncbi:hypothetical protein Bphy_3642 [Paraburkholderia phymatum STM815]|uniref:HTH-like domain-containing protein n=1 Tax=Paraburkholderia phymatum (strain DSM 17167 / CIP 108236 / LMG 21445 / STM815) TaxID=391038 RepID=B2JMI4_PARP8|nr:hypothetical protein Bphy_3642 [Paraburkholderia phymatum STM815]
MSVPAVITTVIDVDPDRPRRRISNGALLVHIRAVHTESKGEYGWPRVWKKLLAQRIRVSKDRIQRLMKLHGIKARMRLAAQLFGRQREAGEDEEEWRMLALTKPVRH